jgi:Tol biopolymer transport system component
VKSRLRDERTNNIMKTLKLLTKSLFGAVLSVLITLGMTITPNAQLLPERIAFHASVTAKSGGKLVATSQVFSMNPDGSGVAQLTSSTAGARNPAWSPGQEYISFWRAGTLYVMEAIGEANGGRTFAVAAAANWASDWSPDGSRVCFMIPGGNLAIVTVNAATGEVGVPTVIRANECFWPDWSPDGTRIVFCVADDSAGETQTVNVLDLATGSEISFHVGPIGTYNFNPKWSPDGSRIAFSGPVETTTTVRRKTTTTLLQQIFFADADGSNITQVTSLSRDTMAPAWSPDGSHLAFSSGGIQKMDLATGVVTSVRATGSAPAWMP